MLGSIEFRNELLDTPRMCEYNTNIATEDHTGMIYEFYAGKQKSKQLYRKFRFSLVNRDIIDPNG